MFRNYVKIAWRNLWKNKLFSGINIAGLSIGIASSILLLSYVSFQFSYDTFNVNRKNIYRVNLEFYQNGKLDYKSAENYPAVGPALKKDFPEIVDEARLYNLGYKNNCIFTYKDTYFKETRFLFAESSFLTMFSYPFVQGDPGTALSQPNTAVISESTAKKLFKDENPMGKIIRMDDDDRNLYLCEVTGVFKDVPGNSHLHFNILLSYPSLHGASLAKLVRSETSWDRKDFYTYVLLRPGADPKALQARLSGFINTHIPDERLHHQESRLSLQALEKIHLSTSLDDEPEPTGNGKAVNFLIIIAFFIITIAWVNYINLSTSGSINRAKEIGIRKVMGSRKGQLMGQFLAESLGINIPGFLIALIMVKLLQPALNRNFHADFSLADLFSNRYGLILLCFLILGSFLSGLYPAFFLSSFKPITVLKGKLKASKRGIVLQRSLVVFQFSLSIFLIIGTFTVYRQVHYMLNKDLGMQVNQVVVMDRPGHWSRSDSTNGSLLQTFKDRLTDNPSIQAVGMCDALPGKEVRWQTQYRARGPQNDNAVAINTEGIDEDYLKVLGIKLIAGRNFSLKLKTDNTKLIVTESTAKLLGFSTPEAAVGQEVWQEKTPVSIIGVVKDFHQESLQKQVAPLIFVFNGNDYTQDEYYLIKIGTTNVSQTIGYIQDTWNNVFKGNPFSFSFMDEYFNRQYESQLQFGVLFSVFSIIAIIIACIGLFALVAFMIEQRNREIGIRKIVGANTKDVWLLLTKDFIRLVLLANLIAWPLGWLLMNNWLNDFAYRIRISLLVFIAAGSAAFIIALATISIQAMKAALTNPVESLRTE